MKWERSELGQKKSVSWSKWMSAVASCNFWQDVNFFWSKIVNVGASFASKDNI